jgi:glycosyltransferase involved in cell wall biosynthesis
MGGSLQIWRRLRHLRPGSAVVVQYSPFCFGRWGFAPWLPLYLWRIRSGRGRTTVALIVHEPYVPMISWRWTLMGLWQRVQLALLRQASDVVFTSIEPWLKDFEEQPPWRPVHHLPVGSNFPDARSRRAEERRRLGAGEETIVVGCLGRDHPTWLGGHVVEAVNAIAREGRPVSLLSLGADAPRLDGLGPGVALHAPGYLGPGELAAGLAASDLFLAPVGDGVSTRRGSVMAALQHGLPVVGTDGKLTDPVLRRGGRTALFLAGVDERERFAEFAVALAADAKARAAAGTAARELYEREFDWPVIAGRLLGALPER